MSAPDRDKVRDLLKSLATPEGRSDFLADPAGKLRSAGIDVPAGIKLPQTESDLQAPDAYARAAESIDAVQFGEELTSLSSPDLAAHLAWFRAAS
jgi:hypothetical protein